MPALEEKVLVLGVGNVLLKDDGLGPLVVRELEKEYQDEAVTFLDGGTLGLDLLAYVDGYKHLLIIDAFDIGKEPGSIFYWEGNILEGFNEKVSTHEVGVKELLNALHLLGSDLAITLMGIQVEEVSWGLELSEKVQNSVPIFKEAVIKRLSKINK